MREGPVLAESDPQSRGETSGKSADRVATFTHSKVMAWLAFDRIIASAEEFGLAGPVDRWK
jgi:GH15 family glucan-1,4-alpha-glucosidase